MDYDEKVEVIFWDITDHSLRGSIRTSISRLSHGFILQFDLTNEKSFEKVIGQYFSCAKTAVSQERKEYELFAILIGNKTDLYGERQVDQSRIESFCKENKILKYFEVSAKTSENVDAAFKFLIEKLIEVDSLVSRQSDVFHPPAVK